MEYVRGISRETIRACLTWSPIILLLLLLLLLLWMMLLLLRMMLLLLPSPWCLEFRQIQTTLIRRLMLLVPIFPVKHYNEEMVTVTISLDWKRESMASLRYRQFNWEIVDTTPGTGVVATVRSERNLTSFSSPSSALLAPGICVERTNDVIMKRLFCLVDIQYPYGWE